jgi:hypothetical protein
MFVSTELFVRFPPASVNNTPGLPCLMLVKRLSCSFGYFSPRPSKFTGISALLHPTVQSLLCRSFLGPLRCPSSQTFAFSLR